MKQKHKGLFGLVLVVALLIALSGCGSQEAPAQASGAQESAVQGSAAGQTSDASQEVADLGDFSLTMSIHDPATSSNGLFLQAWADKVNAATGGHVTVTIYPSAALASAADVGDMVESGGVDIGWIYTSYYSGVYPLSDVINLPMNGFGDPVVSTNVLWDLYDQYPEMQEEWSGSKMLMLYGNPGMLIATADKPVTEVADLNGMVIRSPAGGITSLLTAAGASPTVMGPPDIYESLQKGVIAGYVFEPAGITNFSLQDVTKYYTDYALYDGPFAVVMNWDKWNALPAEYQQAIEGCSGKEGSLLAAQNFADAAEAARTTITEAGGQWVQFSDAAIATLQGYAEDINNTWTTEKSANGFDAGAYLARAKELAAQYGK